jgi:hypothetical protein
VSGWRLDAAAKAEIDRILSAEISDPVGPEFMAPPASSVAARAIEATDLSMRHGQAGIPADKSAGHPRHPRLC